MGAHVKRDGALERVTVGNRKYVRLPLNTRRFTMWNGIRVWKRRNRAFHNLNNTYEGSTLIGQIAGDRVRPITLDEFSILKPIRAMLLGWVTLACKARRAYALRMTRAQWAMILHCHPNTFDLHRDHLESEGWIKVIRDFRPGRFKGRDGEYRHRVMANWYAPGWRLERAWDRYEAHRAKLVQPISDSGSPSEGIPDQNCDPFVPHCEQQYDPRDPRGKVSAAPTGVVEQPTSSASGADGPVKVSAAPTEIKKPPSGAAGQGGFARARPPTRRPNTLGTPAAARCGPSAAGEQRDQTLRLIGQLPLSINDQRLLIIEYDRNPATVGAMIAAWVGGGRR